MSSKNKPELQSPVPAVEQQEIQTVQQSELVDCFETLKSFKATLSDREAKASKSPGSKALAAAVNSDKSLVAEQQAEFDRLIGLYIDQNLDSLKHLLIEQVIKSLRPNRAANKGSEKDSSHPDFATLTNGQVKEIWLEGKWQSFSDKSVREKTASFLTARAPERRQKVKEGASTVIREVAIAELTAIKWADESLPTYLPELAK